MSLWKRGRQYWTDFTVAGRRYRKRLGTTNLRMATRRERELDRRGWTRPAGRPTNKGRSGSRMRSTPTWLPSGFGARRGRSSSRRNGSASSRSTSATCRSPQSPRRRSRSSSARGTMPASRTARSTWTSACCRACSSPAVAGGRSRITCRILPERQRPVGRALDARGAEAALRRCRVEPRVGARVLRRRRRRQHVDAAGRGEAPSPLRCRSRQAARARPAEQERDEPPRHPAQRIGHRSGGANVRARGSARAHRARALPLAGVPVGPLRRHQADAEVGHGLARAA